MTKRETHSGVNRPNVKERHRTFFVALHNAMIRSPGGISHVARLQGRNVHAMSNAYNPNSMDAMPTVESLLDTIEQVQPVQALDVLNLACGRTSVAVEAAPRSPAETVKLFLALVKQAGAASAAAADALADGRLDAHEREALITLLDALITAAVEFQAVARS